MMGMLEKVYGDQRRMGSVDCLAARLPYGDVTRKLVDYEFRDLEVHHISGEDYVWSACHVYVHIGSSVSRIDRPQADRTSVGVFAWGTLDYSLGFLVMRTWLDNWLVESKGETIPVEADIDGFLVEL